MTLWVVIPLLTLVALERVSIAAPPVPLHIDFTAPRGCSHVGAFYAGVLARTDRARRAKPGEKGPRFRVRLTRTGTRVRGELTGMADHGDSNTRKVDGDSCNEVVAVLSLTVALALDPTAGSSPGVAGTPSPSSPSSSSASAPSSPSPSSLPSPPVAASSPIGVAPPAAPPASSPATVPPPSTSLPTPEPPKAPVAVSPVVPPPPPVDSAPPTNAPGLAVRPEDEGPARAYTVDLGARAVVANVVSPYVSLGGALSLLVTGKRDESVPPSLGLALMHVPNNFLRPSPDVLVRWTALALTVCPPLGLHGSLQVQPCGMGVGGWLEATERTVSSPLSVGRTWWSAGALVRTSLLLGRGFSIGLDVGVTVPIVKRRFTVTAADGTLSTVGETPAISGLAGIGVSHSL